MHEHEQADATRADFLAQHPSDHAVVPPKDRSAQDVHADDESTLTKRINVALRATRMLAFPQPKKLSPRQRQPEASFGTAWREDATEVDAQLDTALRVLRALALPTTSAAVVPIARSTWLPLPDRDEHQTLQLDVDTAPGLLRGEPLVISPTRRTAVWHALESWRAANPHLKSVVVIPVLVDDQLSALFVLGFTDSISPDQAWLPTAEAVATACAAGLAGRRLSQRLAAETLARDTYNSLAAHELRSPITSIKGYAQLLLRQGRRSGLPEAMMRSAEAIEQQSSRMSEMVGELLDATRIRKGPLDLMPGPADLVAIVRRAVEREEQYHPDQTFTLEVVDTTITGEWDALRVEQVTRDLLENAARHSKQGSRIATTVERADDHAEVTIRDEGSGIDDKERERIFEYLYRSPESVKRNIAGLGIGLFVSRHIIERHGGELTLAASRTAKPAGSEFRFTLPLEAAPTTTGPR